MRDNYKRYQVQFRVDDDADLISFIQLIPTIYSSPEDAVFQAPDKRQEGKQKKYTKGKATTTGSVKSDVKCLEAQHASGLNIQLLKRLQQ